MNLLTTALYDSTYLSADYDEAIEYDEDDCHEEILANILLNGGAIKISDYIADGCHYGDLRYQFNEDYDATYFVRYIDILNGLEKAANGTFNLREDVGADYADRNEAFAQRSFFAFANDTREWDQTTADCLMQVILFNEIVYG